MAWCPECRVEYREGFERCSECQVELVATLPPAGGEEGPEWVEVRVFPTLEAAELAQGYLQDAAIEAELRDPDPAHHELIPTEVSVALAVAPENEAAARQLLDEADQGKATVSEGLPSEA